MTGRPERIVRASAVPIGGGPATNPAPAAGACSPAGR